MDLSHQHLPCPPLWPHFPPLTSFLSSNKAYILSPNSHTSTPGPLHIPSPSLEHFAPRISEAPISSYPQAFDENVTVPEKPSLTALYKQTISN